MKESSGYTLGNAIWERWLDIERHAALYLKRMYQHIPRIIASVYLARPWCVDMRWSSSFGSNPEYQ